MGNRDVVFWENGLRMILLFMFCVWSWKSRWKYVSCNECSEWSSGWSFFIKENWFFNSGRFYWKSNELL